MAEKLAVKVSLDVEGRTVTLYVCGHINEQNVEVVYSMLHRANSLGSGLEVVLDVSGATVERQVLDGLKAYSALQRLPRHIDPAQVFCALRIVAKDPVTPSATDANLDAVPAGEVRLAQRPQFGRHAVTGR